MRLCNILAFERHESISNYNNFGVGRLVLLAKSSLNKESKQANSQKRSSFLQLDGRLCRKSDSKFDCKGGTTEKAEFIALASLLCYSQKLNREGKGFELVLKHKNIQLKSRSVFLKGPAISQKVYIIVIPPIFFSQSDQKPLRVPATEDR